MNPAMLGRLLPDHGGRPIVLVRDKVIIGRRTSCDICLPSNNVSSEHCELSFHHGCWHVRDLGSKNGVKVNGSRVQQQSLRPGDGIRIGELSFTIDYQLAEEARAQLDADQEEEDALHQPLLKRMGLFGRRPQEQQKPDPLAPMFEDDDD